MDKELEKKFKDAIIASGKKEADKDKKLTSTQILLGETVHYRGALYEEGKGVFTYDLKNILQVIKLDKDEIKVVPYEAPYDPSEITEMSRDDLIKLLETIKNNFAEEHRLKSEVDRLVSNILYHADYIEGMLNAQIPFDGYRRDVNGLEKALMKLLKFYCIIGIFTIPLISKVDDIEINRIAKYERLKNEYINEHPEFEELKKQMVEDYYFFDYSTNIVKLKESKIKYEEFRGSGYDAWGLDCLGEEFYNANAVDEILGMIKSRRADTLKEAINQLDVNKYRQRMEDAQQAILNASEIAAEEAVKQTAYSKETAQSAHESATYAKATAYNTRKAAYYTKQTAKNTQRFR